MVRIGHATEARRLHDDTRFVGEDISEALLLEVVGGGPRQVHHVEEIAERSLARQFIHAGLKERHLHVVEGVDDAPRSLQRL